MRRRRLGLVAKVALVRMAGVLVFGIFACGPRDMGKLQREWMGESVSMLGTTGPSVSEEIDVGEQVRVPSAGWRLDIGAGATSHLVAFQDVPDDFSDRASLFGVRIGFDGAILDALPFAISSANGQQTRPKLAFNGTDWLVAWRDGRVMYEEHVYAARVAEDGTVLDPDGIALATGPDATEPSSVASDGTDFLVTWNFDGVQAAIVSASGTVERSFTVQAGSAGGAAVAFNGTHYLVAYCESVSNTVYLRAKRLTPEGDPVGSIIDIGVGCSNVAIASDGTDWMVAYSLSLNEVTWRAVAGDGTLGAPGSTTAVFVPSIAWGGSSYWLAGDSSSSLSMRARVTRLDRSGNELDSQLYDEPRGIQTRISFGGSNAFVGLSAEYMTARGFRVNESLESLDTPPLLLSPCETWQGRVRSAWGGREHLVVWWAGGEPSIHTDDHIAARRVGANGTPLGSSFEIPGASDVRYGPYVASNGNGYLVASWAVGTSEILVTRVSPSGTVLDPTGISLGPGEEPTVASNGTDYYVVWRENNAARGVRMLADGSIPTGPITISRSAVSGAPVVESNGSSYLVAWSGGSAIRASRVSFTGTVLDASDVSIGISTEVLWQPQIASDGSDWLVVWLVGSVEREIRGARVGANGALKDLPAIAFNSAYSESPTAAWTGREYLVSWLESSGRATYTVQGRRLSAQGRLIDSAAFSISNDPYLTFQDSVDISAQGAGRALITYSRWDPTRPLAPRAKARTFTSDLSEGGEGGAAGAAGADSGGAGGSGRGGSGGTDGGEAGQSSGAAGEAQGGSGRGGAGGRDPTGGTGATTGGDSSGEAGDDGDGRGHGSARIETEGCGCRVAGGRSNLGAIAVALALSAFAFGRRKRSRSCEKSHLSRRPDSVSDIAGS